MCALEEVPTDSVGLRAMDNGRAHAMSFLASRPRKDRLSPRHLENVQALLRKMGSSPLLYRKELCGSRGLRPLFRNEDLGEGIREVKASAGPLRRGDQTGPLLKAVASLVKLPGAGSGQDTVLVEVHLSDNLLDRNGLQGGAAPLGGGHRPILLKVRQDPLDPDP